MLAILATQEPEAEGPWQVLGPTWAAEGGPVSKGSVEEY